VQFQPNSAPDPAMLRRGVASITMCDYRTYSLGRPLLK